MATGFNTQTGGGKYRLQFETDNEEYFLLMQELARCCVDHPKIKTNADKARAMTDEELIAFFVLEDKCPPERFSSRKCDGFDSCKDCWIDWLKQPAEDDC